jgi:glucose dehydrogenase
MDSAAPPILTKIKKNNYDIDVVVAVTKLGNTIILDRVTGEPIYDIVKKRAPTSKIPGEKTSPYQPSINLPEPICRNEFKKEYITNIGKKNNEYIAKIANDANFGFPKPYQIGKKSIQIASCVRWAGASIDPDKNIMFVTADALPDLIEIKKHPKSKYNYYAIVKRFNDLDGYPGIKPPWGTLTSLNLNNGKILWQIPFGEYEELTLKDFPITGTPNRSGATATSGGLVFASGTWDNKIRAFDSENGKELWSYTLSSLGSASPTSFMFDDKQYIIIPAFENNGDEVFAFSLN